MHVIKIGGAVLQQPETAKQLADAWRACDGHLVVVHGGGPQLDQALRAVDGDPVKVQGLRVTSAQAAEATAEVMDQLGAGLAEDLAKLGVPARHVPSTAECFQAVPKTVPGHDIGRVGTVTDVRVKPLESKRGITVVTPVGFDAAGPLNVNADEGAGVAAVALHADRLVLATDVPAVLDRESQPIDTIAETELGDLLKRGVVQGGMVQKLQNAVEAHAAGVDQVTIGPIAAVRDEACGTRIVPAISVTA